MALYHRGVLLVEINWCRTFQLSLLLLLWVSLSDAWTPSRMGPPPWNQRQFPRLQASSSWSIDDDWSALSGDNEVPDSDELFNTDLATKAAQQMELATTPPTPPSAEDLQVQRAVDRIHNNGFISANPSEDPPLYDSGFEDYAHSVSFEDDLGREISLLVNCNEMPQQLLVDQGRALVPLSEEELHDVAQLVVQKEGTYQPTDFLQAAVQTMFQQYSHVVRRMEVMDAAGVAQWTTKCVWEQERRVVGPNERRVLQVLARHAEYGSGYLTLQNFQNLYLQAVTSSLDGSSAKVGRRKDQQASVESVFRDLSAHQILLPKEMEWKERAHEIRQEGNGIATASEALHVETLLDECEILEWGEDSNVASFTTYSTQDESERKRASHEGVELVRGQQTPLRMRDGEFVFIDEESCIGCNQCATVSPNSFLMLESGRARAFRQSNTEDVAMAVSVCPVQCMHNVGFEELKQFEIARDQGDGRSDHRHLGHAHTPLSVAGIDSDANHKSSWYHYLKQKCHMSRACPQRGCYDCPNYAAPGENPYFQKLHRKAESVRAKYLMDSGEADLWRKSADL